LHALECQRDSATLDEIAYRETGDPAYRWNEMAVSRLGQLTAAGSAASPVSRAPDGQRGIALLSVAVYDATVAVWDAKYAYNRPHPGEIDATLQPVLPNPSSPSYPSEHAVVAGAASSIVAYLFPAERSVLSDAAEQAGQSRLTARVEFPSDVKAGLELGQSVAARVSEPAKTDGWDAVGTARCRTPLDTEHRSTGPSRSSPLAGTRIQRPGGAMRRLKLSAQPVKVICRQGCHRGVQAWEAHEVALAKRLPCRIGIAVDIIRGLGARGVAGMTIRRDKGSGRGGHRCNGSRSAAGFVRGEAQVDRVPVGFDSSICQRHGAAACLVIQVVFYPVFLVGAKGGLVGLHPQIGDVIGDAELQRNEVVDFREPRHGGNAVFGVDLGAVRGSDITN